MTDKTNRNKQLANRMQVWAIVALVVGVVGVAFLPNLTLIFDPYIQESWQVIHPIGFAISQFALPVSAALFVGAIVLRHMPERTGEN